MPRFAPGLLTITAVLLVGAAPTRAEPGKLAKVGIIAGVRVNLSEGRVAEIVDDFERVIEREREVDIVVGGQSALKGAKSGGMCSMDTRCLQGVAGRMGVDELLYLVVVGAGDRVRIDFSRIDRLDQVSHPPALILELDAKKRDAQIAEAIETLVPDAASKPEEPTIDDDGGDDTTTTPDDDDDDSVAVIDDDDGDDHHKKKRKGGDAPGHGKRVAGIVISAVGAGVIGGSIFFVLGARNAASELNTRCANGCAWSAELQDLYDTHDSKRTLAITLGIVGAAAIVTGGTLYALGRADQSDAATSSPAISLSVGDGGGALVWSGGF